MINLLRDTKETAGIIIQFKEEILLLKRPSGTWAIPKGHIKEGESHYDGMIRELKEETQIEIKNNIMFLHCTRNKTRSVLYIYHYQSDIKIIPIINKEHTDWNYFSLNNLPNNLDYGLNKFLESR
jgi:8-oxo-dGTP pyrophosphatase MutT (NUDIX family)|tara:strand:- start:543 stop:917 length:375 start_codon:yes stop_codon:yes gene_type:complete